MKIIDMTQDIYSDCPGWYAYKNAELSRETFVGKEGYTSERINVNSHTATHLDAPAHNYADMDTIDVMPIEQFIGEAVIIDKRGVGEDYEVTVEDLLPYENLIKKDSIVLINTGWTTHRGYGADYMKAWPYLSGEGAAWLREKGVKGVGIDGMSIGAYSNGKPAHSELLPYNIFILEECAFPDEIMEYQNFKFVCVPLKLRAAGGSPTRAFAIIEE